MISYHNGYAKTSNIGMSDNPRYKYQVAPDMAMTVRMIMILLYGAEKLAKIRDIPLELIDNFPDHPYRVQDDEDMDPFFCICFRLSSPFSFILSVFILADGQID